MCLRVTEIIKNDNARLRERLGERERIRKEKGKMHIVAMFENIVTGMQNWMYSSFCCISLCILHFI